MKISDITSALEDFAHPGYQEDYDNSGLITGVGSWEAKGALLSLDCTEEVIEEAIASGCNLVVAHHPILFGGIKRINASNYVERAIIKAIKNDVAIYACHTNIDNVKNGVNKKIAEKLGLLNLKILLPKKGLLKKLVTYVPASHHQAVLDAMFDAGAGHIGNYDNCSFNLAGTGTFKGGEGSNPFIGKTGELSREEEIRIETIFEGVKEKRILKALIQAHPYEEVAFDVYGLDNTLHSVGSGILGELPEQMDENAFLSHVKITLKAGVLRHTQRTGKPVKKVALCGGSGRFLLKHAIAVGADAYITADFKYHEFFDADGRILLVDAGHFETEQFTPEIFLEIINKKFPTFAIRLSKINTNPVNYF